MPVNATDPQNLVIIENNLTLYKDASTGQAYVKDSAGNIQALSALLPASGGSGVSNIVGGTGISVDDTDPQAPIVSIETITTDFDFNEGGININDTFTGPCKYVFEKSTIYNYGIICNNVFGVKELQFLFPDTSVGEGNQIGIAYCPQLQSLTLPTAIENGINVTISHNTALSEVYVYGNGQFPLNDCQFTYCALSASCLQRLAQACVDRNTSNGSFVTIGGTSAAPDVATTVLLNTLISRGWNVQTN